MPTALLGALCPLRPPRPAPFRRQAHPQVQAILQTAIDKLAIIGLVNVNPQTQALELTQHVGDGISRMITEQKQLEARQGPAQRRHAWHGARPA